MTHVSPLVRYRNASFVVRLTTGKLAGPVRLLRDLAAARRGATALEFGFVVVPFVALLVACLHTSILFFSDQALETATQQAVRPILTGSVKFAATNQATYKSTQVCPKLPSYMDCSRLAVDVKRIADWSQVGTAITPITTDSNGQITSASAYESWQGRDIVMVRLSYSWPTGGGPLGFNLASSSGNKRILSSMAFIRVEPYQ
jgi:TadE-like protein